MYSRIFIIKLLSILWFLMATASVYAQRQRVNFSEIDWRVQSVNAASPDTLAQRLTAPYTTDLEKVRSIFRWITENIAYNTGYNSRTIRAAALRYKPAEPYDSVIESKSLNERIAYDVLKKKVALCNGYARLFKTLCDYAGIPAEIINGYARTNMGSGKFRSNHTWNAVYIDSAWHLLDATWASGHVAYNMQDFIKHYDDYYFLTPPEQLIRTHYPEDHQWSLLTNPPTLREFNQTPFKHSAFIKYQIKYFHPAGGILQAAPGDTLLFEIESTDIERDKRIATDGYYDSTLMATGTAYWAFIQPAALVGNRKIYYQYIVQPNTVEWLHLVYNRDVILRYKLNIRQKENPVN